MPPRIDARIPAWALAGLAALSVAPPAQAARPLATEDAPALAARDCEAQLLFARLSEAGQATTRTSTLDLGCGIGWNTQVNLNLGRASDGSQRSNSLALSGKTAVVAGSDRSPGWTVAYGLAAERSPGQSLALENEWITGVMTWPLGQSLALHANLGWQHSRSAAQDSTLWAAAVEHTGASGLDWTAELYATDRDSAPWLQLGLRWTLQPERWSLNASWARQTSGSRPSALTFGGLLKF